MKTLVERRRRIQKELGVLQDGIFGAVTLTALESRLGLEADPPESVQELRLKIGRQIVDWEARRDGHGNLQVYKLPANDGGGSFEVAGINERYHSVAARRLRAMIEAGQFEKAEDFAASYLIGYTNVVADWVSDIGLEAFLRDTAFNRGPTGAAKIIQMALHVVVDGVVGPITLQAARETAALPIRLLGDLREARARYERDVVGYRANFWPGLVNRWNKAYEFSRELQEAAD